MDLVTIKKNWNYILLYPFLRMMAEGAIEGSWALSLYFQLIILRQGYFDNNTTASLYAEALLTEQL